jgi:glucokinase
VDELDQRSVLAIDFGGTRIRAALITPDLGVHARRADPTRDEEGADAVIARICDLAVAVRDEALAAGHPEPVAVGISAPGTLDPWLGIMRSPPNLAGWHDVPIAARVAEAVDLPAFLERDTNAAVLAEWRYGAGRGAATVVYITVSTGVGGGAIIDGRPLIGVDGTAGEMGHLVVELDGPTCGCGGTGHVEAIASGTALAREGAELLAVGSSPRLAELVAAGHELDAALLARAADEGDAAAARVLDRAWAAIGALCVSLVNILNPEVIVIGGSIAEHHPHMLEVARAAIGAGAFAIPAARARVAAAQLGDDVSLIGCLPIVNERLGDPAYAGGSHRPSTAATALQGAIGS